MVDLHSARRHLKRIHDDLRNQGLNPLEALSQLSSRLEELGDDPGVAGAESDVVDLVSTVYQEILEPGARNGLGQYLTPISVADLMAEVVCELGRPGDVLDPFCGVGLLLDRVGLLAPDARLLGIEINESVGQMARALSELSANSIEVQHADTFAAYIDGNLPVADVVVTNPPFGSTVTGARLDSQALPEALRSLGKLPAELLGLEVSIQALREGGVLAIVLPQSILTNRRWDAYRAEVLTRLEVIAAVSLPAETFGPFKGVASACVLIGRRRDGIAQNDFPMYSCKSVGYTSTGRPNGESELPEIAKRILTTEEADRMVVVDPTGRASILSEHTVRTGGIRLGDIAEIFPGKNPPKEAYNQKGPWLLKVGDLSGSVVSWRPRSKNRVDGEWFEKYPKVHLQIGDICMTSAAHTPKYIGLKVDLIDQIPDDGALPSGEVMVIRLKPDCGIMPEEILFFFRGERGYGLIQEIIRGSTGHLYAADLTDLRIPELEGVFPAEAVDAYRKAVVHYRKYRQHEMEAMRLI